MVYCGFSRALCQLEKRMHANGANVEDEALMQLLLARADLIRLHDFLLEKAETVEDLDLAARLIDELEAAIETTSAHRLGPTAKRGTAAVPPGANSSSRGIL
jgi:hypothetical protein